MSLYNRQDAKEAAQGVSILAIALVVIVVLATGTGALIWWINTSTSGIKGRGDIQQQRNSASNIAQWSATFNGLDQQIRADEANIATAKQFATAPGATKQDQINLQGAEQNCQTDVAAYNADIQNVLAVVPTGLPTSYPTTACGG